MGPDVRRFIKACAAGSAATLPIYLFVLWDLWGGHWTPMRWEPPADFYELQARAILHGHLWIDKGPLGIEGFVHNGRTYTYFGLFPSLVRIPILLVTSRFDGGQLTAPALLVAWITTVVASAMLFWRLRVMLRGAAALGRAEAVSWGVVLATVSGGSVLISSLAANPWVYSEDFAWSVALTTASLLCLLGVLESPTRRRMLACGGVVVCTALNRPTTGYACSLGALFVAIWLWRATSGPAGARRVRSAGVMAAIVAGSFLAGGAVTYVKFGEPVGLPMAAQVWTHLNAHRRLYLAANGGKAFNIAFVPSTAWAYFAPWGIRLTSAFPFVTAPPTPAATIGHVVLDQTYRTPSLLSTAPLLVLLSAWGSVVAFRPKPPGRAALTRIPLLAAAAGCVGVLVWGYITPRYEADLLPFFILASGIGLADLWRRIDQRPAAGGAPIRRRQPMVVAGALAVAAAWCVFTNSALAVEPNPAWTTAQTDRFVTVEDELTPAGLSRTVEHGTAIPYYAPGGKMFAMADCSGLYLSTGETFAAVPGQQDYHATWLPVEQADGDNHWIDVQYSQVPNPSAAPLTIFSWDQVTIDLLPVGGHMVEAEVIGLGPAPGPPEASEYPNFGPWRFAVVPGRTYRFQVMTDPNLQEITVDWSGVEYFIHYLPGPGPAEVHTTTAGPVLVRDVTPPWPGTPLCDSLLRDSLR